MSFGTPSLPRRMFPGFTFPVDDPLLRGGLEARRREIASPDPHGPRGRGAARSRSSFFMSVSPSMNSMTMKISSGRVRTS